MDKKRIYELHLITLMRILADLYRKADLAYKLDLPMPVARGTRFFQRRLHSALVAILRPLESAARRLIIAMAQNLVCGVRKPGPPRQPTTLSRRAAINGDPAADPAASPKPLPPPVFRLLDAVRKPSLRNLQAYLNGDPIPPRSNVASDPEALIDAAPLIRRLSALGHALESMPRQAGRFAQWRARQASGGPGYRGRNGWPLRNGCPPGGRPSHFQPKYLIEAAERRDVDDVLIALNDIAWDAIKCPDTS